MTIPLTHRREGFTERTVRLTASSGRTAYYVRTPTSSTSGSGYRNSRPSKFRRIRSSPSRPTKYWGCSGIFPPPPGASMTYVGTA